MKVKLLVVVVTFILNTLMPATAQRMRYDDERFEYIRLPLSPLPKNIRTYQLSIINPPSQGVVDIDPDIADTKIRSGFKLDAFERVSANADLKIVISLQGFHASPFQMNEKPVLSVGSQQKEYYHTITYGYPMQVKVIDNATGNELLNVPVNQTDYNYKTETRPETAIVNVDQHYEKMKMDALELNVQKIKNAVQSKYDFAHITFFQRMWAPKTTRKQNYTDLDSAQNKALRAFKTIKSNLQNGFDSYRQLIEEPMTIWLAVLKESDLADKKARINAEVTSSIRHNLAYSYLWLGEFDKAEEQASLSTNEFSEADWPETLIKESADRKVRKLANN